MKEKEGLGWCDWGVMEWDDCKDWGLYTTIFYIAKDNSCFSISQHQNKTSRKKLERVIR